MAINLPRFLYDRPIVSPEKGTPLGSFHQWWDAVVKQIESSFERIELALAAAGIALDGGGALPAMAVRTITVSEPLLITDTLVLADATAGDITVTLPPVADDFGREVIIKKISDPPRTVTVQPNASELIDGASDFVLTVKNEAIHFVSDGAGWWII